MTRADLPKRLWLGLALIVVPFLVLIGLEASEVFGRAPRIEQSRERVVHSFEVITTARELDRTIQDAERGQRGYLVTGNAAYLEPYRTGARDAPALLAKLRELTADNPEQQRRLPNLELVLNAKLAELQRTVEVRDREGFDAARQIMQTNTGLEAMHVIGGMIDATIATENQLLAERLARLADEERHGADAALAGGAITFAAMLLGIALAVLAFRNIQHAEEERSLSEERFRLLADGVADHAIYTLDPNGNVEHWNAGAQRLKGYAADEIAGRHFSRFYTEEDRRAGVPGIALDTAASQGKFETEGWRVRKDGSRFWASVTISPLRNHAGRLLGFAKITHDVTARREQQLALEQARASMAQSQKMQALGQLSGGIAHDFNNLLHVIMNGVDILQRRLKDTSEEVRQVLDMVRRNASRAATLTQRMLAFSRQQPLEPKPINPNKLVAGMVDLLQRALGESIALETVLTSGTWPVSVDANQLEAALLNLAVNARDAMPRGGKLTVETTNAFLDDAYARLHAEVKPGQYVLISVSDNGVGMSEEVRAKAFEPFFTTKDTGEGTGLGLSQVYGFIKQSGGHVKIYSEPGEGTTVSRGLLPERSRTPFTTRAPRRRARIRKRFWSSRTTRTCAYSRQKSCANWATACSPRWMRARRCWYWRRSLVSGYCLPT
jgi:PAS domain S-box-containing protein